MSRGVINKPQTLAKVIHRPKHAEEALSEADQFLASLDEVLSHK